MRGSGPPGIEVGQHRLEDHLLVASGGQHVLQDQYNAPAARLRESPSVRGDSRVPGWSV
jgi:hypothetical protein